MASFGDWRRLSKSLLLAPLGRESKVAPRMRYELTHQDVSMGMATDIRGTHSSCEGGTRRQSIVPGHWWIEMIR